MYLSTFLTTLLAAPPVAAPVDLFFDAPSKPMMIRLQLEVDGKPLAETYKTLQQRHLQALFPALDRDRNGWLDENEARRTPIPVLADLVGPDIHVAYNFKALDADGDGRVTRKELASFYADFEGGPLEFHDHLGVPFSIEPLSQRLFQLLDTNKDGKLSKDEIKAAPGVLAKLDSDGDDIASASELAPEVAPNPLQSAIALIPPTVLLHHPPIRLDATRLKALVGHAPALELKVRLGQRQEEQPLIEIVRNAGKVIVEEKEAGEIVLDLGEGRLEFRIDRSWLTAKALGRLRDQYRREVKQNDPEFLERLLDVQAEAMAKRLSLLTSRRGEGLWDLLDRNRDGFLGIREIREVSKVLASLDRNGDGVVSQEEVVPGFVLQLGPGRTHFNRISGGDVVALSETGKLEYPAQGVASGPLWFRKMDRNGDGDVSSTEFLGSRDDFKKLDRDGDGLISREEAEVAEEKRKP